MHGADEGRKKIRSYPPFNQSIAEGGGISEQERIERRNLNLLQGFPTSFLMFVLTGWLRCEHRRRLPHTLRSAILRLGFSTSSDTQKKGISETSRENFSH